MRALVNKTLNFFFLWNGSVVDKKIHGLSEKLFVCQKKKNVFWFQNLKAFNYVLFLLGNDVG